MGKKITKETFGYLGEVFQEKLVAEIMTDHKFADSIMELIDFNFFEGEGLRYIVSKIHEAWKDNEVNLTYDSLEARIRSGTSDDLTLNFRLKQLDAIKEASLNDSEYTQKTALNFCKQQSLKITLKSIQNIVDKGQPDDYPKCEDLLKKALELGNGKDDIVDVLDDQDEVLDDDFRKPIPTGIVGLDEYMDGGLAKSEVGVILAPYGVGKTSCITIMANHAKNLGYNVLQIFFEDMPKVIKRKHYTRWYNINNSETITLNELGSYKKEVKEILDKVGKTTGILKLKKFASDGTTIPVIRQYIRRLIAQGFKPDIIFLDYIDCIQPAKHFDDVNAGEGNVMRAFETMAGEFDMASWTAVQGNRSSLNAALVEGNQMGGSIKKGQIGHFVFSIAKTLQQKEDGRATLAILKSRFGKDGIIFDDIVFDNGKMIIDTTQSGGISFLDAKKNKVTRDQDRIKEVLADRKKLITNTDFDNIVPTDNNAEV